VLTRDRCKLFLKKHCHCDTDGIWRVKVRVFMFFWGDHGSRGWCDNSQPALRPVFILTSAQPSVCKVSVYMGGVQLLL